MSRLERENLAILYEDNHLLAVNKLPSDIVQGDRTGDRTLADRVGEHLRSAYGKPGNVFVGIPHRLDRPTSGVVLFARTEKALQRLSAMFREGEVRKIYWAVVAERPPAESGSLVGWLKRNPVAEQVVRREGSRRRGPRGTAVVPPPLQPRQVPRPGDRAPHRPPPPDQGAARRGGVSHQGRPEVRGGALQPGRRDPPARAAGVTRSSGAQDTAGHYRRPAARPRMGRRAGAVAGDERRRERGRRRAPLIRSLSQAFAQSSIPLMTGTRALPLSVSSYSVRTGVPVSTVRRTIPAASSSLIRSVSMRALTAGMPLSTSQKCRRPPESSRMMSPAHLRVSISKAFSTVEQRAAGWGS